MNNHIKFSIITVSRNDDHGGNMFKRMQMFVNGLGEQTGRHGMKCELILVEWNPPPDRPPLAEALSFEKTKNRMPVRIITVPNEIHRKWIHWDEIPLFQMIGKNVGIRRAKTDFILCTNVDLLFSDELCEFLAKGEFDENAMYRANRCDVPMEVLDIVGLEEQLKFCKTHVIRRLGQFPWGYGKPFAFFCLLIEIRRMASKRCFLWRSHVFRWCLRRANISSEQNTDC